MIFILFREKVTPTKAPGFYLKGRKDSKPEQNVYKGMIKEMKNDKRKYLKGHNADQNTWNCHKICKRRG